MTQHCLKLFIIHTGLLFKRIELVENAKQRVQSSSRGFGTGSKTAFVRITQRRAATATSRGAKEDDDNVILDGSPAISREDEQSTSCGSLIDVDRARSDDEATPANGTHKAVLSNRGQTCSWTPFSLPFSDNCCTALARVRDDAGVWYFNPRVSRSFQRLRASESSWLLFEQINARGGRIVQSCRQRLKFLELFEIDRDRRIAPLPRGLWSLNHIVSNNFVIWFHSIATLCIRFNPSFTGRLNFRIFLHWENDWSFCNAIQITSSNRLCHFKG